MKDRMLRCVQRAAGKSRFRHIYSVLLLLLTAVTLLFYFGSATQRAAALLDKMTDGANLVAVRVGNLLSGADYAGFYVSSEKEVDRLLNQKSPDISSLVEYDQSLVPYTRLGQSIELFLVNSEKIIVSDYGISDWSDYADQSFLRNITSGASIQENWALRSIQRNSFQTSTLTLSSVRPLPLYELNRKGYLVVNVPMSSIENTILENTNAALGACEVWYMGNRLYGAPAQKISRSSKQRSSIIAAYSLSVGQFLRRSLPNPAPYLLAYCASALALVGVATLIARVISAPIQRLANQLGIDSDEADDSGAQIAAIYADLSRELSHTRTALDAAQPLLRERLVSELLHTRTPPIDRAELLARCEIDLSFPYFAVVCLWMDAPREHEAIPVIQNNVQTTLSSLGNVYSTYGEDECRLFLLNTAEYEGLNQRLSASCQALVEGIQLSAGIRALFTAGICAAENPVLFDGYCSARDQMKLLRLNESSASEPSVAEASDAPMMDDSTVENAATAILNQDASALEGVLLRFKQDCEKLSSANEGSKRLAVSLLCSLYAKLSERGFSLSASAFSGALQALDQADSGEKIAEIAAHWCEKRIAPAKVLSSESTNYVRETLQFIHREYARPLSVPKISQHVALNSIYLNRIFKNATGQTLSEYLNAYRVTQSLALLCETNLTIAQISERVGFSDSRAYARHFRKLHEVTPTDYRNRQMQNENG